MALTHRQLRERFSKFLVSHGHAEVPPISLVPQNDPTTLFTGSGMQQFVPYLLGQKHPQGTRLFNIQHCIRVQDIEEVGDNRHDTLFEMMGNWSLGDYFKKEQLQNFFTFLTDKKIGLGLDPKKLFVTVFEGNEQAPRDTTSIEVWTEIFKRVGISSEIGERIFLYPAEKNWWSRAGEPKNMPAGEPGGPDSEVFYLFDVEHDPAFGKECHPNCDCGRFMEIGNSVFMQYKKLDDGSFENLPKMNVDFGGGLERLLAAANNDPDIFHADINSHIVNGVETATNHEYEDPSNQKAMRIIADHLKTATFIIKDGITPSNKEQGYVLRRLLRRALVKIRALNNSFSAEAVAPIVEQVVQTYNGIYFDAKVDTAKIIPVIQDEISKFQKTLDRGLRELEKLDEINGTIAFDLYQTYGFPFEITQEIMSEKGIKLSKEEYDNAVKTHQAKSRSSADHKFKGGLADQSNQTVKYHTATHLLHQALFDVIGDSVRQEGSNITADRLRFDFYCDNQPTDEDIEKVEKIMNEKISQEIPVNMKVMDKKEAETIGARSFFKEKYPDEVKIYFIGKDKEDVKSAYSKEFCGGPHVENTKEIGEIQIKRFKKIGSNMFRIYAK
ncbi:alanine--tRNA ligase [Candidatus Roizmanbacteria bacterium CG_4_9_14_0_2_um_filter_39_13]|uniref:alanine--tRNA ligase n=2 Tax=Candidatus Roizmaniibacteriota TaxID=1752723 RepID=A0A2M8F3G8_9BACT|nr:MAG: alanine--tRNA ligase [Candidatus Roizmanbacteria bacterium CG_4_10_14_0_2_um_filter_39_12]PJC33828.1 MAG: alanine--tRNA ligase [Candidatus Roizmanbacteria bacterium CG_4_9_14_0_2_um_filter_39_13]PJE62156.1 MAG: alanine--tRNA ligase [Candidatus Roizmanbacteria bacterium CG10_big_fil_rev_8_21_14_0_10_39_12]